MLQKSLVSCYFRVAYYHYLELAVCAICMENADDTRDIFAIMVGMIEETHMSLKKYIRKVKSQGSLKMEAKVYCSLSTDYIAISFCLSSD